MIIVGQRPLNITEILLKVAINTITLTHTLKTGTLYKLNHNLYLDLISMGLKHLKKLMVFVGDQSK